jgi:glycerate kinase
MGQVRLYGRQKGLRDADIPEVESAFLHFASLIEKRFGVDVTRVVRSTGSGGLAAALHAFLNANLVNTLEYLSEHLNLVPTIRSADIAITGEGCLDRTTKLGKVPYFVAKSSSRRCIALVGSYTPEGFNDMTTVCNKCAIVPLNPELALSRPREALRDAAKSICVLL